MHEAVQQPNYDEMICGMVHQVQPSPRNHGSMMVDMKKGHLIIFLSEYEENCVQEVQMFGDEVRINFCNYLKCTLKILKFPSEIYSQYL